MSQATEPAPLQTGDSAAPAVVLPALDYQLWRRWRLGERPHVREFLAQARVQDPNEIVAALCVDQRERWQIGERIPAESYLTAYPEIAQDGERALELVYSEFLHREQAGESPTLEEYLDRFPQMAARLRLQITLHHAVQDAESLDSGDQIDSGLDTPVGESHPAKTWPTVPGYEIVGELGRGGMGVVYQARHVGLNRLVALKMIRAGAHAGPDELARFRSEAETLARLQHPHIVQVYDVGVIDGCPYFSLEYVDGGSLAQKIAGRPQPPRGAAEMVQILALAVNAAHAKGVVHRDLKPANILLVSGESVSGEWSGKATTEPTTHHSPLTNRRSPTSGWPSRWSAPRSCPTAGR